MRLHAIEAGPAEAPGEPVVLLHGLFGQARNLGRLQRVLARERRTLALDLRSHGSSPAGPLDLRAMGRDVVETISGLGVGVAVLVGHSLGGKVAMAAALGYSGSVSRLLVADIAPVGYRHGHLRYARALQALELAPGLTRATADAALAPSVAEPAVRALLLQNLVTGERPSWRSGLDEIAASIDGAEGWPEWEGARFDGPALFVRGERSDYLTEDHMPAILRLFPRARLAVLWQAGHWLHVDRPDEFAAIVREFVAAEDAIRR